MSVCSTNKYQFVFLVTHGRTGSTFLMRALNTLEGVQIRGENGGILMSFYRSLVVATRTRYEFGKARVPDSAPFYGADLIDPHSLECGIHGLLLNTVLRPSTGVDTVGFKEIRHGPDQMNRTDFLRYVQFLLRFPSARIIMLRRNHDDVRNSGWWASVDPEKVSAFLGEMDERYRMCSELNPDQTLLLDYGIDLYPDLAVDKIEAFLSKSFNRRRLESVKSEWLLHKGKRKQTS